MVFLSKNKRRICVGLYHRNKFSLGENRTRLMYNAYHWGIIVKPKHPDDNGRHMCNTYDARDMAVTDPVNHINLNPNYDWFFRSQHDIDPNAQGRLIVYIIVGKLPSDVSDEAMDGFLGAVPLPVKSASAASLTESCVTWTLKALDAFQSRGWIRSFDLSAFKDRALEYGDECMGNLGKENICEYNT